MTLRTKLQIGVAFVSGLVVSIIVFSLLVVSWLTDLNEQVLEYRKLQTVQTLWQDTQLRVANVWQFFTDASLTRDEGVIKEEAAPNREAAVSNLKKLNELKEDVSKHENALGQTWGAGYQMFEAYYKDFEGKNSFERGDAAMDNFDKASGSIIDAVAVSVKEKQEQSNKFVNSLEAAVSGYKRIAIILAAATSIVGIGVSLLIIAVSRAISAPLRDAIRVTEKVAAGDLSENLTTTRTDEIGQLLQALGGMVVKLRAMIADIQGHAADIESQSCVLQTAATEIAQSVSEQSEVFSQISTASIESSQTSEQIAQNTSSIASVAENVSGAASDGLNVVSEALEAFITAAENVQLAAKSSEKLSTMAEQICEITSAVDDIADQTNLLALNASIEAARAGEQGRGFAVVADEVRKLASKTTEATRQISTTVSEVTHVVSELASKMSETLKRTDNGVTLSLQAKDRMTEIVNKFSEVEAMTLQIASATEEMSSATQGISAEVLTVAETSAAVSQNSAGVSTVATALVSVAKQLHVSAERFRVN